MIYRAKTKTEGESGCKEQCDHCKEYYKPIEKTNIMDDGLAGDVANGKALAKLLNPKLNRITKL